MVERVKSDKNNKSKTDDAKTTSENIPDVGGLAASIDALMSIADKGDQRNAGEVVHLSSRKDNASPKATSKTPNRSRNRAKKSQVKIEPEALGVVELLSALKSDIDSLRKDNEEFKARLMNSTPERTGGQDDPGGDVRSLLEALKDDIGNLRHENDLLRSQAFAAQSLTEPGKPSVDQDDDHDLYVMLAELKDDIVSLRSENDFLRRENRISPSPRPGQQTDEVALMLKELKADINDLKHENESLRIENLTARDGTRFEALGVPQGAYRNTDNNAFSSFLKGLGALVLVVGAAGGGYYLAKSQGGAEVATSAATETAPVIPSLSPTLKPVKPLPRAEKVITKVQPVKAPVAVAAPRKVKVVKAAPVAPATKTVRKTLTVSAAVETAMMTRAGGLLDARDLGAARMVFVYLARHGSAAAMTRLAQTYDPQYLATHQFDDVKNGDLTRAIRLYGAASGMGDEQARNRLAQMQ